MFTRSLAELQGPEQHRRWVYVPYDQQTADLGPLSREQPDDIGIVIVESSWKARRRPYHKQKLALLLANQRQFALEQARRGVAVRFLATDAPFSSALRTLADELGPMQVMRPAERELRVDLAPLIDEELLEVLPHEGWLTTRDQFDASHKGSPPFRMDAFYRRVRQDSGILMEDGAPVGGKYSFDAENRKPWRGDPPTPDPPTFHADDVTREVLELVEREFGNHPGELNSESLPSTRSDALRQLEWAVEACLPQFGPYEDAMSIRSSGLFHTRLSPLLNLQRLTAREVLEAVLGVDLPLSSKEGFVRQLLGWREFVRHVHESTDGFRRIYGERTSVADTPGDGGWSTWMGNSWPADSDTREVDGGAVPSHLNAERALPPAFWRGSSGLRCLDHTVAAVWRDGYTHHIPRLMVLSNIATLLGVSPRELTDWFWVGFTDAYDWVVEPNVLAMGTFGVGPVMTTKPYVSGAAYINRMSDFCDGCSFDPKKNCPITQLYWAFLDTHSDRLADNPRMRLPLSSMKKRSDEQRQHDRRVAQKVTKLLTDGKELTPDVIAEAQ